MFAEILKEIKIILRKFYLNFENLQDFLKNLDKSGIKLPKFYIKLTKILR